MTAATAAFRCSGRLPLLACEEETHTHTHTGSGSRRTAAASEGAQRTAAISYRLGHRGAPAAGGAVVEVDIPGLGDGRALVEVHQLVEGGEPLGPQVVLAVLVPHHLEVLDVALVPEKRGGQKQRVSVEGFTLTALTALPPAGVGAELRHLELLKVSAGPIRQWEPRLFLSLYGGGTWDGGVTVADEEEEEKKNPFCRCLSPTCKHVMLCSVCSGGRDDESHFSLCAQRSRKKKELTDSVTF